MFWEKGQEIRLPCPECGQEADTGGDHRWVYKCECPAGHMWTVEKSAVIFDALLAARIDVAVVKVGADEVLGGAAKDALERFGY